MPQQVLKPGEFRVNDLSARHPTPFELLPDAAMRGVISKLLSISATKKLRFTGEIAPAGALGWTLRGKLGATIVQPCVVTLNPVTTRIDEKIERVYLPPERFDNEPLEANEDEAETEIPEDTNSELLGSVISAYDVMIESLTLALPLYPRSADANLGDAVFTEDGIEPIKDEDLKPFAGLASLRDQLEKKS